MQFGDQDPLVDFFDTQSNLYAFQQSAAEGGPEGVENDDDESSDDDNSSDQDMDDSDESDDQSADDQLMDDDVAEEGEDGGWVDEE